VLRLLGYFALVFVVLHLLRFVPWIGGLFAVPFLGFLAAAAIVSLVASHLASLAVTRRRVARLKHDLGATDTPHNRGKLGSLLVAEGRHRLAVPHLEAALAGEPASVEWRYRLGCALLAGGRTREAVEALSAAAALDEKHAYGALLLRLAQARLRAGDARGALEALDRRERNHGESPESLFRRGLALRALGRGEEARAAFAGVGQLARGAARFQRGEARWWALRAALGRFL